MARKSGASAASFLAKSFMKASEKHNDASQHTAYKDVMLDRVLAVNDSIAC